MIEYFSEAYKHKYDIKYPFVGGRDGKAVKNLLSGYNIDFIKELIDWYFDTDDEWINEHGRSLSMLVNQINKFVSQKNKPKYNPYAHIKVAGVNA